MIRARFAPSPTGSLHVGNALNAVAARRLGDWMLLRIDDTDPKRNVSGGEEAILRDLEWLGIGWEEGPVRQSERHELYRAAAERLGVDRFDGVTLLREDGTATYHLASVVDDAEFGITHVVRGFEHRPNEALHRRLHEALGTRPPEYVHHGLLLGDGGKLAKRAEGATLASLRDAGIPPEAMRRYLEELGVPKHDVRYDLARIRRLAVEALAAMPDDELAGRVGVPVHVVPVVRGARDLAEAREYAELILTPPERPPVAAAETLERFRELRERANGTLDAEAAREIVRELKAVGADLRALRLALTGRERGPELWAVIAALPRDEALRRVAPSASLGGR